MTMTTTTTKPTKPLTNRSTKTEICAALAQLPKGTFKPREVVVGVLTGHGLKHPPLIM